MSREDDEYYGNIQDIEDLIQREMRELNKMQEVVNKKRSTLNDMGVKLEIPKELEDSGLLDILNTPSPAIPSVLKSPMSKDIPKLDKIGTEAAAANQPAPYRFGRPKTPDITLQSQQGGIDFVGKNKENLQAIAQKKKLEKEEREKSLTRKSANNSKYESVGSKIKENLVTKSSKALEKSSNSPKKPVGKVAKRIDKSVTETHLFEEEDDIRVQGSKPTGSSSARSLSKPKAPAAEIRQPDLRSSAVLSPAPKQPTPAPKSIKPSPPAPTTQPEQKPSVPPSKSPKPAKSPSPLPSSTRAAPKPPNTYSSALPQNTNTQQLVQTKAVVTTQQQNTAQVVNNVVAKPPKSQNIANKEQKPAFRPETMDLFSKLEEYTKYKENLDLLNRCEEESVLGGVFVREETKVQKVVKDVAASARDKENIGTNKPVKNDGGKKIEKAVAESAGEFLKNKISGFGKKEDKHNLESEKTYSSRVLQERSPSAKNGVRTRHNPAVDLSPKRSAREEKNYSSKVFAQAGSSPAQQKTPRGATPQKQYLAKSIDLKKVVEPRFKRDKVEMPAEPSFQPMLSRKSLLIAEKMGYNGEKLWHSKTPTKTELGGRGDSQDHASYDMQGKSSSPWMSRLPGGQENGAHQHSPNGPSFQPKICEKSKQIDGYKQRGQGGPRHEVLHQLGMEQNMKLERRIREKVKEEEEEIKAMSFQPKTMPREGESFYRSGVGIADRNEQWALRKEERIQRLKDSQIKAEAEQCSFKPKLVD